MFPKRRMDRITVRTMPTETLLYDGERNKVHCLNATSTLIWKHCDGQASAERLTQIVQQRLHLTDAAAVVRLALEQLYRRGLLDTAPAAEPLTDEARLSRRAALKKFAIAAAAALPIVMTLTPRAGASALSQLKCRVAGRVPGPLSASQDRSGDPPYKTAEPDILAVTKH